METPSRTHRSSLQITARYAMPFGEGGELFAFTDWAYQGDTNLFLYKITRIPDGRARSKAA